MTHSMDRRNYIYTCSASALPVITNGLSDVLAAEVAEPALAKTTYDIIVLGRGDIGSNP